MWKKKKKTQSSVALRLFLIINQKITVWSTNFRKVYNDLMWEKKTVETRLKRKAFGQCKIILARVFHIQRFHDERLDNWEVYPFFFSRVKHMIKTLRVYIVLFEQGPIGNWCGDLKRVVKLFKGLHLSECNRFWDSVS